VDDALSTQSSSDVFGSGETGSSMLCNVRMTSLTSSIDKHCMAMGRGGVDLPHGRIGLMDYIIILLEIINHLCEVRPMWLGISPADYHQ